MFGMYLFGHAVGEDGAQPFNSTKAKLLQIATFLGPFPDHLLKIFKFSCFVDCILYSALQWMEIVVSGRTPNVSLTFCGLQIVANTKTLVTKSTLQLKLPSKLQSFLNIAF